MYVINDLTFIAHPRTASRACSEALLAAGAVAVNGHHRMSDCTTGTVACVVRNMFDVMVSWWHNANFMPGTDKPLKYDIQPFNEYLREKAYDTTHRWFIEPIYHYGLPRCNLVLRYENLAKDFNYMLRQQGVMEVELPVIGASKRACYGSYYTPELREIVEDRWGEDLLRTGYKF